MKFGIRSRPNADKVGQEAAGRGRRSGHHCHALGCTASCPPRHLMCEGHWAMVPAELQTEVYATAKARGPYADATWAPWWRASHRAIHAVRLLERPDLADQLGKWLDHQLDMAAHLERKGA